MFAHGLRARAQIRRPHAVLSALALVVLAILALRGNGAPAPVTAPLGSRAAISHGVGAAAGSRRVGAAAGLTPAQLAGQRIIYSYAGLRPPGSLLAAIRGGEAAGVILFAPNIAGIAQIHAVTRELQRAAAASPVKAPLLILTDQEGGVVRRLPGAPTLSERRIGTSADPGGQATRAGTGAGQTLRSAGVNVNLTPVLDVFRHAGNFIDRYGRSYSSNASTVRALGGDFITAQQRLGVAATAKHFPGLGAATRAQNTDLGLVRLNQSLTQLRGNDEAPYRRAVAAGVKLVMTSWAVYPALDPRRPAGLSATVIGRELRGRLGFRGVTITDAIGAGSLAPFGSFGRRGALAAQAGADLILCSETNPYANTPADGVAVRDAIVAALRDRQLGQLAAQRSAARVLALRQRP